MDWKINAQKWMSVQTNASVEIQAMVIKTFDTLHTCCHSPLYRSVCLSHSLSHVSTRRAKKNCFHTPSCWNYYYYSYCYSYYYSCSECYYYEYYYAWLLIDSFSSRKKVGLCGNDSSVWWRESLCCHTWCTALKRSTFIFLFLLFSFFLLFLLFLGLSFFFLLISPLLQQVGFRLSRRGPSTRH